jgi:hypothetical protein
MKITSRKSILLTAIILLVSQRVALAQDHAAKVQEVLTVANKYRQFTAPPWSPRTGPTRKVSTPTTVSPKHT